jgi:hypothetical protein
MMEQLGQLLLQVYNSKNYFRRSRNTTAALAFGGNPPGTAATEEFTITGTEGIKTITVS